MDNKKFIEEVKAVSQARHKKKTVDTYIGRLTAFSKYYINTDLYEITSGDINEYLIHLKRTLNYQPASMKAARDGLHFVYNVHLKKNFPIDTYSLKWNSRKHVNVPTQKELFLIFNEIENLTIRIALELMYGTGVELSEMLKVKVKDIDFTNKLVRITLNRNKGFRNAILPIKLSKNLLNICSEKSTNDYVFSNNQGKPYHSTSISKPFKKSVKKYNSELNYNTRSLKHAFIKHLELSNIPLTSILSHLKLKEVSSLEFYSRIGDEKTKVTFSPIDKKIEEIYLTTNKGHYISLRRILELESTDNSKYDFKKLCQLLKELNIAHSQNQLLTKAMIIRSIMNHVPPIFDCSNFTEIANNYSGNSKSFKTSMKQLDTQLKNIADIYLHQHIRKKEELPEEQQVDFRSPIDLLLQEILTVVK